MDIDWAARATRWYWISGSTSCDGWIIMDGVRRLPGEREYATSVEAQAACDRMNLLAVLEAIREPTDAMATAGYDAFDDGYAAVRPRFKAMIDALIAEVGK